MFFSEIRITIIVDVQKCAKTANKSRAPNKMGFATCNQASYNLQSGNQRTVIRQARDCQASKDRCQAKQRTVRQAKDRCQASKGLSGKPRTVRQAKDRCQASKGPLSGKQRTVRPAKDRSSDQQDSRVHARDSLV